MSEYRIQWLCRHRRLLYAAAFVLTFAVEAWIALYVRDAVIRPYVGDILVVFAVYFFVRMFLPRGVRFLWLYVTLFAMAVEISQYFNLARILGLEAVPLANMVLGSVFDWKDMVCYLSGGLLLLGGRCLSGGFRKGGDGHGRGCKNCDF